MSDITAFLEDMDEHDLGFMTSLTRQMAMVLDTFYSDLKRCGISSFTGKGFKDFHNLLKAAQQEFFSVYLKEVLPETLSTNANSKENVFINLLDDDDEETEEEENEEDIFDEEPKIY